MYLQGYSAPRCQLISLARNSRFLNNVLILLFLHLSFRVQFSPSTSVQFWKLQLFQAFRSGNQVITKLLGMGWGRQQLSGRHRPPQDYWIQWHTRQSAWHTPNVLNRSLSPASTLICSALFTSSLSHKEMAFATLWPSKSQASASYNLNFIQNCSFKGIWKIWSFLASQPLWLRRYVERVNMYPEDQSYPAHSRVQPTTLLPSPPGQLHDKFELNQYSVLTLL